MCSPLTGERQARDPADPSRRFRSDLIPEWCACRAGPYAPCAQHRHAVRSSAEACCSPASATCAACSVSPGAPLLGPPPYRARLTRAPLSAAAVAPLSIPAWCLRRIDPPKLMASVLGRHQLCRAACTKFKARVRRRQPASSARPLQCRPPKRLRDHAAICCPASLLLLPSSICSVERM